MYGLTYRILTAVHPDAVERVSRILEGHDLHIVNSIGQAKLVLDRDDIQLIFVGARFDDSHMFEFLDFLRKHVEHRKIPIAAAIVMPTVMSKETISGLAHTSKIYGATVFVNLNDFPDHPIANTRVRIIIEALVAPEVAIARVAGALAASKEQ